MVCSRPPSVKSSVLPTAQTSLGETAVTPVMKLFPLVVGKGFGLGTTLQEVPFQCSVSVAVVPPTAPTAQASPGEIAATPRRSLRPEPTLGLATTDHLVPFQCSVSVRSTDPTSWNPAAHASVLESAETAFKGAGPAGARARPPRLALRAAPGLPASPFVHPDGGGRRAHADVLEE